MADDDLESEKTSEDKTDFYRIIPKKVLTRSICYQFAIALPFISFVFLLIVGILKEPDVNNTSDPDFLQRITILYIWLALFSSAAFFSCLGSLVSYSARRHVNERDIEDGSLVLSMNIVGAVFGIILLLLFIGGFVAGSIFPNFRDIGLFQIYANFSDVKDWAKLFIWTFIAGFSERLMPNLLGNFAKRIQATQDTR